MDLKKKEQVSPEVQNDEQPEETASVSPSASGEEEHTHSNYRFALKVLGVLLVIILIIVILQASGVSVALRDWLFSSVPDASALSFTAGTTN